MADYHCPRSNWTGPESELRSLTREELDRYQNFIKGLGLPPNPFDERLVAQARRAIEFETEIARLKRGIVANAGNRSNRRRPRWSHVCDAVGVGSTTARQMCREAQFDPEELTGQEAEPDGS